MTTRRRVDAGDVALAAVVVGWITVLGGILRHRIFVSHDTLINYAHVWFVSHRLWHDHVLPLRMPVLGHGGALAFPYAFVPWLTAAVFRPLAGDRIVTVWLVLGATGVIVATFAAFPELRRGWWATAVLLNPALFAAAIIGQLPFLWGSMFLMAGIASWRRGRRVGATVLVALAQITHPAVVAPIAAVVVALALVLALEHDRRALLRHYAVASLVTAPAAFLVWRSPVFVDSSVWTKLSEFVGTVGPRMLIVAVPLALVYASRRWPSAWTGAVACALSLLFIRVAWTPQALGWAWRGLDRNPSTAMLSFVASPTFVPDATYRLLRVGDGRVGAYQLIRAGGRLDSEFFPESVLRQSFASEEPYSRVLRERHVDFVMVWHSYPKVSHTNEKSLLDAMAAHPPARCDGVDVCVRRVSESTQYSLYAIDRST